MRLPILSLAAAALVGLTGCEAPASKDGGSADAAATEAGADEASAETEAADARVPSDPADAPGPAYTRPYPGAEVTSSVLAPGDRGGMLTMLTPANPDTVIAYYRQRAEEAGLASGASMNAGGTRQYAATSGDGAGLNVVVAPHDDGSVVTVTWDAAN